MYYFLKQNRYFDHYYQRFRYFIGSMNKSYKKLNLESIAFPEKCFTLEKRGKRWSNYLRVIFLILKIRKFY